MVPRDEGGPAEVVEAIDNLVRLCVTAKEKDLSVVFDFCA
jgi:hypothetical protein